MEVPAAIWTLAEVKCLLSIGSEGRESAVNAYTEEKVENLNGSGLQQMDEVIDGAIAQIL